MISGGAELVMWEQFKECFYGKYFSAKLRHLKEKEFLSLEQGSMSVEEHDQEFRQLSGFALTIVAIEAERTKRFVQGLRDRLRGLV